MASSREYTTTSRESILTSTTESTPDVDSAPPKRVTLHASSTSGSSSRIIRRADYVPYRLGFHNCGLFPDFYFQFEKNFSKESKENAAYCNLNLQDFTASYEGSEDNIRTSVARVKTDFSRKFRACLDSELLEEFSEWLFTREFVENRFCYSLANRQDLVSEPVRLEELDRQIRKDWRVQPIVDFLTAFGYSELAIWTHLIQALGVSALGHSRNQKALNVAAEWKTDAGTLSHRAQAFADLYKAAKLILPLDEVTMNIIFYSCILSPVLIFLLVYLVASCIENRL